MYLQARVKPLQLIHYTGSDKLAEVMDICQMSVLYLQARVKPLQLIHYTGSDKLAEVMDICPKLRYVP
jgi:hypothetical protein